MTFVTDASTTLGITNERLGNKTPTPTNERKKTNKNETKQQNIHQQPNDERWTTESSRADTSIGVPSYKTHMKLTIFSVTMDDYGTYKCVAKNPRGETDGTIRLYSEFKHFHFIIMYSHV